MHIKNLYLEVTRKCTLQCEHCLRGESEAKQMSVETVENTLKEIQRIDTLLLSGGEPLLNIEVLEALPEQIRKHKVQVERIGIITNGTVMTKRHIEALKKLKDVCSSFEFYLSSDLFHRLEWQRLGIEEKVQRHFEEFQKHLPLKKYLENDCHHKVLINSKGRAKHLTPERLQELKKKYDINYSLEEPIEKKITLEEDTIKGKVCIDVNGFLVGFNHSYEEEDEEECLSKNVNLHSLAEIIPNSITEKPFSIKKDYN